MDPQQRLLLELGYEARTAPATDGAATCCRAPTRASSSGSSGDWALLQQLAVGAQSGSAYAVTADTASIAGGRLSFALGLRGPCASVDTACSSALVALHGACAALRGARVRPTLAAAASLKLLPYFTLSAAAAGMLSADGRCKTFDARANGYVRSEGVGALLLRAVVPSSEGRPRTAAVVGGSAVRQDGKSAS